MNLCAENFIDFLNNKNIKHTVDDDNDRCLIKIRYGLKHTSSHLHFYFNNDNEHLSLRVYEVVKFPEEKKSKVIAACNECHKKYKWVKFVAEDDNTVIAGIDAIITPETAASIAFEMDTRILDIVNKCYPDFMKAIWA